MKKKIHKKHKHTWKTVSSDCQKLSKLLLGVSCVSSKLNLPPNSCIPSRAKMTINKKSSSSKLAMERILFSRDATRFLSEFQYLHWANNTLLVNLFSFVC